MTSISISNWIKATQIVLNVSDPVWKAWRAMKDGGVKILPVSSGDKIVGLISAQDIVRASNHNDGQSMSVQEAMNLDPLIVNINTGLVEVVRSMVRKDQQHAIVVDETFCVVGIFSWMEAFLFFLENSKENANNTKRSLND